MHSELSTSAADSTATTPVGDVLSTSAASELESTAPIVSTESASPTEGRIAEPSVLPSSAETQEVNTSLASTGQLPEADNADASVIPTVFAPLPAAEPLSSPPLVVSGPIVADGSPISLPNGKAGEHYAYRFTPDIIDLEGCTAVRVLGPDGLGMTFQQDTQTLAGIPTLAGEYELKLSYQPVGVPPSGRTHVRTLRWYVNPDPRSLWTEQEPPAELPARKAHIAHIVLTQGPKTLVAASIRGRSHAKDGKFREDDFRCVYHPESGSYILAVADGAGSAVMSREGSRLACETATEHLLGQFQTAREPALRDLANALATNSGPETRKAMQDALYQLLGNAALSAARHLTQVADAAKQPVRDYATTLLLAICQPTAAGWLVGAFWVGDGGLGLYRHQEGLTLLGEPDSGEYSGQTRFLTMKETFEASTLYKRVRFEQVPDFDALVLMTDGVTDALFQTDANLLKPAKWGEMLADIQQAAPLKRDNAELGPQVAQWLNFWVKGEYDDRTLAILF